MSPKKKGFVKFFDLFKPGVSRRSCQLMTLLATIDRLIKAMEKRTDLKQFASDNADMLNSSIAEMRRARGCVCQAMERLNFPVSSEDQNERKRFREFWQWP